MAESGMMRRLRAKRAEESEADWFAEMLIDALENDDAVRAAVSRLIPRPIRTTPARGGARRGQ